MVIFHAQKFLFAALLLAAAGPATAASPHSLEARISYGSSVYKQVLRLTEGRQANHVGPLNGKQVIVNGLLVGGADGLTLQYQLELTDGPERDGRSIQLQSEAVLRPGVPLAALDCGPWSVTLTLDPVKAAPGKAGKAWDPAGLPNYRLTADVSAGGSRQVCKIVSKSGTQSNVVDGLRQGSRKFGFILNSLLTPAGGNGFRLQYQLEKNSSPAARAFQLQNEEKLTLGKRTSFSGEGYKLVFLLEGSVQAGGKAAEKKGYGTVQLIQ